jgi:hypothetical protein
VGPIPGLHDRRHVDRREIDDEVLETLPALYSEFAGLAEHWTLGRRLAARLILPDLAGLDDKVGAITKQTLGKLRGRYSLDAWGARLGIPKIGADIADWSVWTPEIQARCAGDIAINKALWHFLNPDGYDHRAIELEHRAAAVCARIEADGVPFDVTAAGQLEQQWISRRTPLEARLKEQFPGTKLTSRKQIAALLEARGWVPEKRTEKTKQPKARRLRQVCCRWTRSR